MVSAVSLSAENLPHNVMFSWLNSIQIMQLLLMHDVLVVFGEMLGVKCSVKGIMFDVVLTITKHMSAMLWASRNKHWGRHVAAASLKTVRECGGMRSSPEKENLTLNEIIVNYTFFFF